MHSLFFRSGCPNVRVSTFNYSEIEPIYFFLNHKFCHFLLFQEDHAFCCVEMGLSMIETMKIFDSERHENIKMRVGIHTGQLGIKMTENSKQSVFSSGNVLCGIVGTKRVKFDVWSNDVTFANKMESTGKPDLVHVSSLNQFRNR